jgi:hypothetical protein
LYIPLSPERRSLTHPHCCMLATISYCFFTVGVG